MSLGNISGTIGTVVGLGITLGALGLALEFVDRSFDRASPNKRKGKRQPIFDMGYGGSGSGNGIFDVPSPKRSRGKKSQSRNMYGDFF